MILRATVEKDYKIRILGYRVLAIFIAKPITVIAIRNVGDDIGCAGHLQESAKNGGGGGAGDVIVAEYGDSLVVFVRSGAWGVGKGCGRTCRHRGWREL